MKLTKTVVGSFPVQNVPIAEAIKNTVNLQLENDIDIVSDGEQRSDMLGYFECLPGLGRNLRGVYVNSKISSMDDPNEFIKLKDLQLVIEYLEEKGKNNIPVKVAITGPVTLGFFCGINGLKYYSSLRDPRLYSDIAEALNPIIRQVAKKNCYIQIDEPSLSSKAIDYKDALKFIEQSISGLPNSIFREKRIILHACGPLNENLLKDLIESDVPVLSLAFSAPNVQKNIDLISKKLLQSGNKSLGVGCISVEAGKKSDVEGEEVLIERLGLIVKKVGEETIEFVHPDCGLRNCSSEAAELILRHMRQAVEHLRT